MATLPPSHHQECKKQWTRGSSEMREGQWRVSGSHMGLLETWVSLFFSFPSKLPLYTWLFYCLLTKKHLVLIIGKFYY